MKLIITFIFALQSITSLAQTSINTNHMEPFYEYEVLSILNSPDKLTLKADENTVQICNNKDNKCFGAIDLKLLQHESEKFLNVIEKAIEKSWMDKLLTIAFITIGVIAAVFLFKMIVLTSFGVLISTNITKFVVSKYGISLIVLLTAGTYYTYEKSQTNHTFFLKNFKKQNGNYYVLPKDFSPAEIESTLEEILSIKPGDVVSPSNAKLFNEIILLLKTQVKAQEQKETEVQDTSYNTVDIL